MVSMDCGAEQVGSRRGLEHDERASPQTHINELPAVLYRHFDAAGQLLYVGISLYALRRLGQHRSRSHWFKDVATITIAHFPTRLAALSAELRAIREENPVHNTQLRPARRKADRVSGGATEQEMQEIISKMW